ncbi:extracellular solute-binding protein [Streptomyces sp. NPDC000410]|uniref:extracellular solute-binding protein n=1 Tax=Streptomyces sp. NPDC000410 TaxID=3154254 RepID=UPI0033182FDE
MTSRRTAFLLAFLLLALGACTGDGGTPPAPSGVADPGRTILVASGRDVTGKGGIREKLIEEWEAKPGNTYKARLVELPGSADQQRSQLLGALQSGSARYDVVNLDVTWIPEFAEAELIQELDAGLVDKDVIASVARTARWNDKVYSIPFNTDVGLLYYRRDHLERARVRDTSLDENTTWEQVRDLIRTVERAEPPGHQAGWTTQLAQYEGLTVNGIEAFASVMDQGLTDERGHYTADPAALEDGLDELRRRTDRSYLLPAAPGSDEAASLTDFANGRTTFLRHWPYAYRTLHQSLTPDQLGVAPLPGKAVLGGQNLALTTSASASGERAEAARDLIAFLTDPSSERCLLDAGFAATRTSAYKDDKVSCRLATCPAPSSTAESADRMPRDDCRPRYASTTLLAALEGRTVERPRTPHYGAFTQTFTTHLRRLFGDSPPTEKQLARELDAALRQALPDAP